jgi:FAD binding domain-containing protein/berberine-like enzyme
MTQTIDKDVTTLCAAVKGAVLLPGDEGYGEARTVWNGDIDRRPAVIVRCAGPDDVAAALRYGQDAGLEVAVRGGGHGYWGAAIAEGGLVVDLSPLDHVTVDPEARRARVGGGAKLGQLDAATQEHGLAVPAGTVSHTGVGGLTLGGGWGWFSRMHGFTIDNLESAQVVLADGRCVTASATEHPDLFWGLRGGGGNFGVVTEFEFRIHPTSGQVLVVDLTYDPADAIEPMRIWRDLLPTAPRAALFAADAFAFPADAGSKLAGRPVVTVSFVWSGSIDEGRAYLETFRSAFPTPVAEDVAEMRYVELQSMFDERNGHGLRRYSTGHYLPGLPNEAIDAFLSRGIAADSGEPDWSLLPGSGFQAYGGAIADLDDGDSAFSFRDTLVEWVCGATWSDPAEDDVRMGNARRWARALDPWGSGTYVNVIADAGEVRRAYRDAKFARLVELKRAWDPDNVFHLNHNISPDAA